MDKNAGMSAFNRIRSRLDVIDNGPARAAYEFALDVLRNEDIVTQFDLDLIERDRRERERRAMETKEHADRAIRAGRLGRTPTRHEYFLKRLDELGLMATSSDYNGMIGRAVEMLSTVFSAQHHSGGSATITLSVFAQLMREWDNGGVPEVLKDGSEPAPSTTVIAGDPSPLRSGQGTFDSIVQARLDRAEREFASVVNRNSLEKGSDTPDYVLAQFIRDVLVAFDLAVMRRSGFYGRHDAPGSTVPGPMSGPAAGQCNTNSIPGD